jgi:TolB-like protein/DNA-binding winged helix-turn-helix (wHTH) protein/Tfp pilus assembly protein PilF
MATPNRNSARLRFGGFELDPQTGELVCDGQKIQLHEQPLQVLLALLERPGELVTREELAAKVWPAGTFVDFEHGLNKAVSKLRDALKDSADQPQFIETLPRKGYRFVGELTREKTAEESLRPQATTPVRVRAKWWPAAVAVIVILAAILLGTNVAGWRDSILEHRKPVPLEIASLAVLPLENLSGDPEQAYFADGITDALITELARVGTFRVISRTTMLRYRETQKTTQQIGHDLHVDALVEGTVLYAGDKVRITAQLIQVSTDNHLWARSYERDVTEVLRLQREVVADIAHRVGHVVQTVEPPRTISPQAYGEYLKGRFYFFQYTPEGWQKAIEHFGRATQADPNFAPAYAGLAESYLVARGWNAFPPDEALQKGKAAAQRALQLDSTLASAHLAIGAVYAQYWDHANAEKEFKRGIELNPNDPLAWQQHGNHLLSHGQFQQAIAEQQRALSLDPFSPIIVANLARAYYYSRQYDEAIAQAKEALKLEPNYPVALRWLERAFRHKDMPAEAFAARLAAAKPEEAEAIERAHRASGYRGVLQFDAETYKRQGALIEAARGYAQAGNKEEALAALEECYRLRGPGLERLKVDPDLDPIRPDPRYKDLLRRVGFVQ